MVPLSAPAPNPHTYGVPSLSRSITKRPGMQSDFVHLHTWLPNFTPNGVSSLNPKLDLFPLLNFE